MKRRQYPRAEHEAICGEGHAGISGAENAVAMTAETVGAAVVVVIRCVSATVRTSKARRACMTPTFQTLLGDERCAQQEGNNHKRQESPDPELASPHTLQDTSNSAD